MTPLVSVIIPLYNGAHFIGETLDSVYAQDYAPLEVLVMDDGSTDDGPDIARGRGARVLRHEGKGVQAARNAAIAASRGEILALLDQDDLWLPGKTTHQVEALTANPGAVSFVRMLYFLEPGMALPAWFGKPELLEEHDGYSPSCMAMRREIFDKVGPFEESLTQAGDLDWIARAKHLEVPLEVVPKLLVRRRLHGENESGNPKTVHEMFLTMRRAAARRRADAGETK